MTEAAAKGGAIGVGTWLTQAEFKDIKVTRGDETLFACDFADGTKGWKLLGEGDWKAEDGVLRQNSRDGECPGRGRRPEVDRLHLHAQGPQARRRRRLPHPLPRAGRRAPSPGGTSAAGATSGTPSRWAASSATKSPGSIETGRWYDIRIELKGSAVKCYLDGKLIHDVSSPGIKSLYASASRDQKRGEVILKVVNVAAEPLVADLKLEGVRKLGRHATAVVLTSEAATDENTLENPTRVVPKTTKLELTGPSWQHQFPGNSLTVLRIPAE